MERKKHRLATCSSTFTIGGEPFGQWRKQACGRKLSSLIGRNWKTLDFETRQKLILENLPRGNANDQPCYNRALRLLLACAREEKEVGAIGIKRKHIMKRSLSLPEIEKKWSLLTHAPEELKLQFLACLPLSDLVAMAQINKDFLSFIGTHLDGISQIQYPLEDKTMAKCSLAYFEGDKCPTTEAEWKQKGRLLGHDLQDCRIWCQETHLFWDTVLHWIYENIHVEAIEYKGHVYPAQVWNSEQGMDVEPKFFPAPEEIQYILRLKEPVRVWNESEWKLFHSLFHCTTDSPPWLSKMIGENYKSFLNHSEKSPYAADSLDFLIVAEPIRFKYKFLSPDVGFSKRPVIIL